MRASLSIGPLGRGRVVWLAASKAVKPGTAWHELSLALQLYVAIVIAIGLALLVAFFPTEYPQPLLLLVLAAFSCLTSTWKINLPIPVTNGSTLSVSYAAHLVTLLLLGPRPAVLLAALGFLVQCHYRAKERYPFYRSIFSSAVGAITMALTSIVYAWLDGPTAPTSIAGLAKPLVGAIATYFFVNTGLIAGAIAFSSNRRFFRTWHEDFFWSGASFMVAGSAGAIAAIIVSRGDHWKAMLLIAPIYLTYRTYELFVARLEDQKTHTEEIGRLHEETVAALDQAREAEHALADEKERLALTLSEMTRLEESRKQLLEGEQAARASAEEANRLKDQFLAIVSHELRTPLNAILGWSDMLRRGRIDERLRQRALDAIHDSAKRQAQLIEDLLDVARIASGKLRLSRTFIDLNEVIRDAMQVVQPSMRAKNIELTVDAHPHGGAIYGDGARLQQVAINLLSNAVKFTPDGGGIVVRVRRLGSCAEMIVTDTGQGIAADFLPSVFEPFRQGDASTTRVHAGLGLGLSIVKDLVEAHGGVISAESPGVGQGATFTVRLPLAMGAAAADSNDGKGAPGDYQYAMSRPVTMAMDQQATDTPPAIAN